MGQNGSHDLQLESSIVACPGNGQEGESHVTSTNKSFWGKCLEGRRKGQNCCEK